MGLTLATKVRIVNPEVITNWDKTIPLPIRRRNTFYLYNSLDS